MDNRVYPVLHEEDFYSITIRDGEKSWRLAVAKDMDNVDWNRWMTQAIERLRG